MDSLTNGSIDIYAEFGIAPDASDAEIHRQYRKLALRYHPDKDLSAGAQAKFHLHQAIHSVLTQPTLRQEYNEIVRARMAPQDTEAAARIAAFRAKLRRQEQLAKAASPSTPSVQVLALKGVGLRRKLQEHMQKNKGYVGTQELKIPVYMTHFGHKSLHIFWKHRTEPDAQIDAAILAQIMAVFGSVTACDVLGLEDRYCKGAVTFLTAAEAESAVSHDYSQSSALWRSTKVRKQASLLRKVKLIEEEADKVLEAQN